MLLPPDADLARRDPDLPGLRVVLDPQAFIAALRAALPEVLLGAGRIEYIRYKPRTKCLVTYVVPTAEGKGTMRLYARALRPQLARPGRVPLRDSLEVYIFPHDRILRSLRHIERRRAAGLISEVLPEWQQARDVRIRPLRYKPERRFVGKVKRASGRPVVLRLYAPAGYLRARRAAGAARSDEALRIPPLLGWSDERRALTFAWVRGTELWDILLDPGRARPAAGTVGRALAEFHAQPPARFPSLAPRSGVPSLASVARGLAALSPAVERRAVALADHLSDALARVPGESHPIHGDFYDRQVLLTERGAAFLDLDEAGRGDPAADAGLFIAHMQREVLRATLAEAQAAAVAAAFLEGYRTRRPLSDARVQLHLAAGLLRLAPLPFREHEAEWPDRIEAILRRAEIVASASINRVAAL